MNAPTHRTAAELLIAWENAQPLAAAELLYLMQEEPGVAAAQAQDDADEAAHQAFLHTT